MSSPYLNVPGTDFMVPADDDRVSRRAMELGTIVVEPEIGRLERIKSLPAGAVVLDVGAFIGDTTRLFLDMGFTVHAFEPYADAFHCLKRNCPEACCHNVAVGDGSTVVQTNRCVIDSNMGTRQVIGSLDAGEKTIRLDDLDLPVVHLLKIDVEGFEPVVLRGARRMLARHRPLILIEVYRTMLNSQGFSTCDIINALPHLPEGPWQFEIALGDPNADRCDLFIIPPTPGSAP